jgi:arsenite methyltransferase
MMTFSGDTVQARSNTYWQQLLTGRELKEGDSVQVNGAEYAFRGGILRQREVYSAEQEQTREAFGFKWEKRDTYESPAFQESVQKWLIERYLQGDPERLDEYFPSEARVLDAGCGAGNAAMLLLGEVLNRVRYLGVDISTAVEVARDRFSERGLAGEFVQADFTSLPFDVGTFDVIMAEGTLHHTDSTQKAFASLAPLLAPGGRFMFYVYRKKAPLREYSDDLIRESVRELDDATAWEALMPLTRLGRALGELNVTVDVPQEIPYLGIASGPIDIQRFFYWFVFKAYYHPEMTLDEMNHVNFDWYRPLNAHRQTEAEVSGWCEELGLEVEHMDVQEAGITVVARRPT